MSSARERSELQGLATEINSEHAAVEASLRTGLAHALRAGELLIAAKSLVGHGEWLSWLAANCAVSERTAQAYMRLTANRPELEAKSATGCGFENLSFRQGLKLLADSKPSAADVVSRLSRPNSKYIPRLVWCSPVRTRAHMCGSCLRSSIPAAATSPA